LPTKGSVCTALLGTEYIDNEEELCLLGIDDFVDDDMKGIIDHFRHNQYDAGAVSFTSVHPRYSFAKLDDTGAVVEVSEKSPISKNALVSFYYFRHGRDFVACAKDVIRKDNPIGDVFYISQTLNEMILQQKKIGLYRVQNDKFHPLKTEAQLSQYLAEIQNLQESK
jgi:dTDP-glucose pyrophosphorylase